MIQHNSLKPDMLISVNFYLSVHFNHQSITRMNYKPLWALPILIIATVGIANLYNGNYTTGNHYTADDLKSILQDTLSHNVTKEWVMIKNDATAVKVVEPILFDIYGRDHIIDERPYEVQMIGNYYIIDGTLTSESDGGTFHIVIDKRNSRIVKLTHGK